MVLHGARLPMEAGALYRGRRPKPSSIHKPRTFKETAGPWGALRSPGPLRLFLLPGRAFWHLQFYVAPVFHRRRPPAEKAARKHQARKSPPIRGTLSHQRFGDALMFFVLSKVLGVFAFPSNVAILIGILGLLLLPTRLARA